MTMRVLLILAAIHCFLFERGLAARGNASLSRRPSTKRRSRTSRAWLSRREFWCARPPRVQKVGVLLRYQENRPLYGRLGCRTGGAALADRFGRRDIVMA